MIARGLSSGTICLGCRLRLLRQVAQPNLSQSHRRNPRLTAIHPPQRQQWYSNEASARPEKPDKKDGKDEWTSVEAVSEDQAYRSFLREQDDELPDFDNRFNREPRSRPSLPPKEREENFRPIRHIELRKRHLSGKKILTETSESLGSDMLGKPAFAIVMRDTGAYRAKRRPANPEQEEREREKLDIQALLESQLKPPTHAEVRENINALRPSNPELLLREKDFRKIQLELEEGFLKDQLHHYIETFKPDTETQQSTEQVAPSQQDEEVQLITSYKWIRRVAPWTPVDLYGNRLGSGDRSSRFLHAYLPPDASPKARAATRIMRECWGLQMEEIANGPGEMRVTLHTQPFVPLMRGTRRFLRNITRTYLEEGESIEASVPGREIRILAPRYKCQTILAQIDTLIRNIETHTFPVAHVTTDPSKLTEELLEQVGHVTNTHVQLTKTGNRIQVAWIQLSSYEKQDIETLSHVVFRFLYTALQPETAGRTIHTAEAEKTLTSGHERLLVDHSSKEKWAWKDRLGTWARLVTPVSAPDQETEAHGILETKAKLPRLSLGLEKPDLNKRHVQVPIKELEQDLAAGSAPVIEGVAVQDSTSSRFPHQPVRWSTSLKTNTNATFGHVLTLHNQATPSPSVNTTRPSLDAFGKQPHNFSPVTPHLLTLSEFSRLNNLKVDGNEIVPVTSTILVRFLHNPDSAVRALPLVAPPLELRLFLSEPLSDEGEPQITGVHSLRAVTATHHNDVLLPADPVDFRITQIRSAALQGSSIGLIDWQPIADFLSRSRLDFGAGKLEMASRQRFQVPFCLFETTAMTKEAEQKKKRRLQAINQEKPKRSYTTAGISEQEEEQQAQEKAEEEVVVEAAVPEDSNALRSTLYEFVGLELHRSVTVPYPEDDRFSLVYTSIEAGQGGGRRSELSLRPVPASTGGYESSLPADTTGSNGSSLQDDYIRACYSFAQKANNWTGFLMDLKVGK